MSHREWNFTTVYEDLICIEDIKKTTVLGIENDGEVVLEKLEGDKHGVPYKHGQLWKKGEPNAEGYFTLKNSSVPKVLTATSSSDLKIQGKITLR